MNEKGFTLIEVLISMGLLTMGLLSVSYLIYKTGQVNMKSGDLTTATIIAQDTLEQMINADYGGITSLTFPSGQVTVGPAKYDMNIFISENFPMNNMKGIFISVCTDNPNPYNKTCSELDYIIHNP